MTKRSLSKGECTFEGLNTSQFLIDWFNSVYTFLKYRLTVLAIFIQISLAKCNNVTFNILDQLICILVSLLQAGIEKLKPHDNCNEIILELGLVFDNIANFDGFLIGVFKTADAKEKQDCDQESACCHAN